MILFPSRFQKQGLTLKKRSCTAGYLKISGHFSDNMVLCAKIGPSILNADLSDLAGECSRLLDQVCPSMKIGLEWRWRLEEHAVEIIVEGREVEKKRGKTTERAQRKGEKEGNVKE